MDKGDASTRRVFTVPKGTIEIVKNKLSTINKKAEKFGMAPMRLVVVDDKAEYPVEDYHTGKKLYSLPAVSFYIEGEVIRLPGDWRVLAVKTYESGMKVPLLARTDPELDIPRKYFTLGPECDHCKLDRKRRTTFVLSNNDGKVIQVGKSCLKDFLGHYPEGAIFYAMKMAEVDDWLSEWEPLGEREAYDSLEFGVYLNVVAHFVSVEGYVRSGQSDARGLPMESTADAAWGYFADLKSGKVKPLKISEETVNKAKKALAWGRKVAPDLSYKSDYWHNMLAALTAEVVTRKTKGLVASVIPAYNRHLEKKAERERQEKSGANEWVGKPKERLKKLRLKLEREIVKEGMYGTTHILKFTDEAGHAFTWFASSGNDKDDVDWKEGAWYAGAGTVKKHDEFRGQKQTVLTRCSLKQELPDVAGKKGKGKKGKGKNYLAVLKEMEKLYLTEGSKVSPLVWDQVDSAVAEKVLERMSLPALTAMDESVIKGRHVFSKDAAKHNAISMAFERTMNKRYDGKGPEVAQDIMNISRLVKAGDYAGFLRYATRSDRMNPESGILVAMGDRYVEQLVYFFDVLFASVLYSDIPPDEKAVWAMWQAATLDRARELNMRLKRLELPSTAGKGREEYETLLSKASASARYELDLTKLEDRYSVWSHLPASEAALLIALWQKYGA